MGIVIAATAVYRAGKAMAAWALITKNTILVIVNYVVLGSIENLVIIILLYILE
jgi:hypothetical protein